MKSYGHLCQIYQNHSPNMVMSRVTLASNSKNFHFSPNSVSNFRISYQIWGKLAKNKNITGKKTNWGVENTPVVVGLKVQIKTQAGHM